MPDSLESCAGWRLWWLRLVRSQPFIPFEPHANGGVLLDSGWNTEGNPGQVLRVFEVETSANFEEWVVTGTAHHWPFRFHSNPGRKALFYRVSDRRKRSTDDWKNVAVIPGLITGSSGAQRWVDEPFFAFPQGGFGGSPYWMKFTIRLDEPGQPVVFQDSRKYVFHYEFARARLEGFEDMSRKEFDAVSLFPGEDQRLLLGAVMSPTVRNSGEVGIQIVGATPYDLSDIASWFHRVSVAVNTVGVLWSFTICRFSSKAGCLKTTCRPLQQLNVSVSSPDRWNPGNGIYSQGWAVGRLVFVESSNIDAAFASGDLLPTDILFTDGIPAEVPPLAGIVSLSPATPNSHVAILAKSFGIPFAYVRDPVQRGLLPNLIGAEIYFAATQLDLRSTMALGMSSG